MLDENIEKIKSGRKKRPGLFFGLVVLVLVLIGLFLFKPWQYFGLHTARVNDTVIKFEYARTYEQQLKGLCCRKSLPENQGMIFVYDSPGRRRFWMKDTLIPLDMYWLDSGKEIVYIEHDVQPNSYPKTFGPETDTIQYVLETNAGFAKKHNIKIGDTVNF